MKHRILSYLLTGLVAYGVLGFSAMAFGGQWEEKAEIPRMGAITGGGWGPRQSMGRFTPLADKMTCSLRANSCMNTTQFETYGPDLRNGKGADFG